MSQHDFNIANQGFPATRADINNAFQAIASNSSGPTAPSTTYANMWWYDTTNNKMYLRNEADSAWIEVATIDQTNNEWQITTGVVKAKDSDGLALQTDDGTTRLFINDSDGAVGIGTGSPVTINGGSGLTGQNNSGFEFVALRNDTAIADNDFVGAYLFGNNDVSGAPNHYAGIWAEANDAFGAMDLQFAAGRTNYETNTPQMTILESGKVGIGTSSPNATLSLGTISPQITFVDSANTSAYARILGTDNGSLIISADEGNAGASSSINFEVDTAEAMRIDSSGNLLVGKTSSSGLVAGCELRDEGTGVFTRSGSNPIQARRLSSDGTIIHLLKDSTETGYIGAETGATYVQGAGSYTGIYFGTAAWIPRKSGANAHNAVDLGNSSFRFDDINATNGTIQTSDEREKQQIASLTDAEMTAAKAISKLFKTFKWNDAVTEKGDAARKHTGVIAQQVEQAITDAGLDAGDYAFFISSTWWETYTDVPAVEAVEAVYETVTDDEGNEVQALVSEAVEGKEAYTRTDTYYTAEEAPEGATERNRKGIRYPELLSFIGAATEQRLASIESRLDALEA